MPYKDPEEQKKYQKLYHLQTWESRKRRHHQVKVIRRTSLVNWLKDYKKDKHCSICGESNPSCLDFHHKDQSTKIKAVATMISDAYSIRSVLSEIEKCIILCANCHRKLHGV